MEEAKLLEIYGDVECFKAQWGTKKFVKGPVPIAPNATGNRKGKNGSGGVIVIDVDIREDSPEKSANIERLFDTFPGIKATPTLTIKSKSAKAFHMVYRWPDEYPLPVSSATSDALGKGVEMPSHYMMPNSVVDGVKYDVGNDRPVAVIPTDLALVLMRDTRDTGIQRQVSRRVTNVDSLLSQIANAPDGERNNVWKKIAPALIRELGAELALEEIALVWPGSETQDELRQKVQSTARYIGANPHDAGALSVVIPSWRRHSLLSDLMERVRYGAWSGGGGANDRRVMLALVIKALDDCQLIVKYPVETMCNHIGTKRDTVEASLRRLHESGLISFASSNDTNDGIGWGHYGLIRPVLGCLLHQGEYIINNNISFDGISFRDIPSIKSREYPYQNHGTLEPLSRVWRADGLMGRHGQLFDLVDSGVDTRAKLIKVSGAGKSTVKEAVNRLIEVGLLAEDNRKLRIASDIDAVVSRITKESGVDSRYETVRNRIDSDHTRLANWQDKRAEEESRALAEEAMRYWSDEELRRQSGV